MPMNPQDKEQWATDLESGEFAQGPGMLTHVPEGNFDPNVQRTPLTDPAQLNGARHCCLGVLCYRIWQDGKLGFEPYINDEGSVVWGLTKDGYPQSSYLPVKVMEAAGYGPDDVWQTPNLYIRGREISGAAGVLNDGGNHDFRAIAKAIREDTSL